MSTFSILFSKHLRTDDKVSLRSLYASAVSTAFDKDNKSFDMDSKDPLTQKSRWVISWTYTFQFCPVDDGEGTVANHQLRGGDDVHHPWTFFLVFVTFQWKWSLSMFSVSPVILSSKFYVFYHTDCLEVILLVAEEYFLVRVLCFFSLLSQISCLFFLENSEAWAEAWLCTFSLQLVEVITDGEMALD